jgi:hypothetical protein
MKLTVLAFHYFLGDQSTSHPAFDATINRLNAESVVIDQGVFLLRTAEDAAVLSEALDYLQSHHKSYLAVDFEPAAHSGLFHGPLTCPMQEKLEGWLQGCNARSNC